MVRIVQTTQLPPPKKKKMKSMLIKSNRKSRMKQMCWRNRRVSKKISSRMKINQQKGKRFLSKEIKPRRMESSRCSPTSIGNLPTHRTLQGVRKKKYRKARKKCSADSYFYCCCFLLYLVVSGVVDSPCCTCCWRANCSFCAWLQLGEEDDNQSNRVQRQT